MVVKIREFEKFLKSVCKIDHVRHKNSYLTAPGENYGSVILKSDITIRENGGEKELCLVIKLCPNNEVLKEAFLTDVTFKKEILAYSEAARYIEEFEANSKILNPIRLFAKCYGARLSIAQNFIDKDALIVLENLKQQNYTVGDRFTGFNLPQTELILKKLAQLHATVIAIRILNPKGFQTNILPTLTPVNVGSVMVDGFLDTALHFAKSLPELEPHINKMAAIINDRKNYKGLVFPVETNRDFYSMIHTDLWSNNILVRQVGDTTTDIKIIDLQLLEFGSIIRDLLLFLYTSVQLNVVSSSLHDLITHYHQKFFERLSDFGCDSEKYSYDFFMGELNEVAPHEFFHIIFMLKPIFSERGSIENMDGIKMDDFGRMDNMGQIYLDRLKFAVLSFVNNKWI